MVGAFLASHTKPMFKPLHCINWVCWLTLVISALWRWRQEDEFEVILNCTGKT